MTGMDFFQSIGEIDEACLAGFDGGETASGRENAGGKSEIECKKAYRSYRRIVMAAAIALLLTVSAIWYMAAQQTSPQEQSGNSGENEQNDGEVTQNREEVYVSVSDLLKTGEIKNEALVITQVPVNAQKAIYAKESAAGEEKLAASRGEELAGARGWYRISGHRDLQYLICEAEGAYTLWKFQCFEDSDYSYQQVLREVYGIYQAEDIRKITVRPADMDNTDEGKALQREIGTLEITDPQEIAFLYQILCSMQCYGADHWDLIDYGASDGGMTEAVRLGRYLILETASGESIDTLKYTGVSGMFYEYGGIAYSRLSGEDAAQVEEILGIVSGSEG